MGYNYYTSKHLICRFTDLDYPIQVVLVHLFWSTGSLCDSFVGYFSKISQIKELEEKVPLLVALNIVTLGFLATAMAQFLNWGPVH